MSAREILLTEDVFAQLVEFSSEARARNEAETRHKLINLVLQDILGWPRNSMRVEEHVRQGFADYVLHNGSDEPLLVIEAKREGIYFELPDAKTEERSSHVALEKLLSDAAIKSAITQARGYAIDLGAEFASITNGHEWVFFRAFAKGKSWEKIHAFVVRTPLFFKDDYTLAYNSLSHGAVTRDFKLTELLSSAAPKDRNLFFPKDGIASDLSP